MSFGPFSKQDHVQIFSLGMEFATSVLAGGALGFWLDKKWGTLPWLFMAGIMAGFSLGFYSVCRKTEVRKKQGQTKENGRS